jgi:PAS domain S-box-containing protein
VFSQDDALRYTFASNPMFGHQVDEIIGRTDEEILPVKGRADVIALKHRVAASDSAETQEVALGEGDAERWYELHLEPLRGNDGVRIGLTCAAVDITDRKANEAHLRLLMRELTHRSKNLLAVIQAMARQSERFAGSTASFLEQFNARLHALASSHDLLVRGSWHGASLGDLIRSQLGHHLQGHHPPVEMAGPDIVVKPEAAQSLGLALHELATNAVKYGALSTERGRVSVTWRPVQTGDKPGIEIVWVEMGGPPVNAPTHSGFGTLVIDHNLARSLDASVALSYQPDGLRCRIVIPFTQILAGR